MTPTCPPLSKEPAESPATALALTLRGDRRALRDARRAKQRAANEGRALKMHEARIAASLSQDLLPAPCVPLSRVHVGCAGWFYWHWRGGFYGTDLPTREWFAHYAEHFKTVELNAPFYSWPTCSTVQSWCRQAAHREFIYTVKAS